MAVGLTVTLDPVCPPDHLTVPLQLAAVSVADWPEQMLETLLLTVGAAGADPMLIVTLLLLPLVPQVLWQVAV